MEERSGEEVPSGRSNGEPGEARQGCRADTGRLTGKQYIEEKVIGKESTQDEGKTEMRAWQYK